jgi:hypothetical protein
MTQGNILIDEKPFSIRSPTSYAIGHRLNCSMLQVVMMDINDSGYAAHLY